MKQRWWSCAITARPAREGWPDRPVFCDGDEGGIGIGAVNAAAGEDERCPGSSNCFLDGRGMSAPWAFRGWFGADPVSPVWLIVVPETSKWIGPGRPAHISRMSMRTICGMRVQAWPKKRFRNQGIRNPFISTPSSQRGRLSRRELQQVPLGAGSRRSESGFPGRKRGAARPDFIGCRRRRCRCSGPGGWYAHGLNSCQRAVCRG